MQALILPVGFRGLHSPVSTEFCHRWHYADPLTYFSSNCQVKQRLLHLSLSPGARHEALQDARVSSVWHIR